MPSLPKDPVPALMEFDPQATPDKAALKDWWATIERWHGWGAHREG